MTHTKSSDSGVSKKTPVGPKAQWGFFWSNCLISWPKRSLNRLIFLSLKKPEQLVLTRTIGDIMAEKIIESIDISFLKKNQNNWCKTVNFVHGILSKRGRFHDCFITIAIPQDEIVRKIFKNSLFRKKTKLKLLCWAFFAITMPYLVTSLI